VRSSLSRLLERLVSRLRVLSQGGVQPERKQRLRLCLRPPRRQVRRVGRQRRCVRRKRRAAGCCERSSRKPQRQRSVVTARACRAQRSAHAEGFFISRCCS
jgi:hypothetical protein